MENQRIILFFALSFVLLLIWQSWQKDFGEQPQSEQATIVEQPQTAGKQVADVPATPAAKSEQSGPATPEVRELPEIIKQGKRIHVLTDLLDVQIDTIGGDVRQVELLDYPVKADKPDVPFRLMEDTPKRIFIAQSGLLSKEPAPDHHAEYLADKLTYQLPAGSDEIRVPLHWRSPEGIAVTKTFVFRRNSYVIKVEHVVKNDSQMLWQGNAYRQLQRSEPTKDEKPRFIYTYIGGVIYSPENKYEKIKLDDMTEQDLSRDIKGGWAAMIQHYFVGAWVPEQDQNDHFYTKAPPGQPYVLGLISPQFSVEPGKTGMVDSRLYVGPKDQQRLKKIAKGLDLTVDYGVLTVLAKPIFWLMGYIHSVIGNWGWSIIILTLLIKLVFYKLSETSYRSMANMRTMQPKIVALRKRYGDDRQRMSQAMMELYKKEKINPLGGCLPMVVQIPVFIALYWVLLESVELRQTPFMFWIHDLSTKDPYYILPLLMGTTMFIQQRLNPPPPDPIQAKVMMALPFIFTLFFAFFPSGLVLYWVTNSSISILQQWYITRSIEKKAALAK